jgi:hypothetical protein
MLVGPAAYDGEGKSYCQLSYVLDCLALQAEGTKIFGNYLPLNTAYHRRLDLEATLQKNIESRYVLSSPNFYNKLQNSYNKITPFSHHKHTRSTLALNSCRNKYITFSAYTV